MSVHGRTNRRNAVRRGRLTVLCSGSNGSETTLTALPVEANGHSLHFATASTCGRAIACGDTRHSTSRSNRGAETRRAPRNPAPSSDSARTGDLSAGQTDGR